MKVYFDFGSTSLNEDAKKSLDKDLIKRLRENPLLVVEVGAHTDDVGSELANIQLLKESSVYSRVLFVSRNKPKENDI